MNPVQMPNLPTDKVTAVIIDGRVQQNIIDKLEGMGIQAVKTCAHPDVYQAVAYHPDIMLHHVGDNIFVYAPNTPRPLLDRLAQFGCRLVQGQTFLSDKYPGTIAYNVARVGNHALHNTKYTDSVLRQLLMERDVKFIHTKQGYTKCLTCVVASNSIITSDRDITKKATAAGIEVLNIDPDSSISLESFDMGFFGGATGLIGRDMLAVAGNLQFHKNSKEILSFLSLKHVDVVMLNDETLIDIGTIMPFRQK